MCSSESAGQGSPSLSVLTERQRDMHGGETVRLAIDTAMADWDILVLFDSGVAQAADQMR